MNATAYTVQLYDTWQLIAHLAYGQPERWPELTAANPNMALLAMPTPGATMWVPVIDPPSAVTSTVGLPPWRR